MFNIRYKTVTVAVLTAMCLVLGYLFADVAYDFENYLYYLSNPSKAAGRFASEPAFLGLVWVLRETMVDEYMATHMLFSVSFFLLAYGVLRFGYAVKEKLLIRSSYVVPICFLVAFPLLALMAIAPRQCLASGFSFMAMAAYINAVRSGRKIGCWDTLIVSMLFSVAMLFHNLSTVMALSIFAWLFFRWKILLFIIVSTLMLGGLVFFMGLGKDISSVVPMIGSAMQYITETNRQTGFYRLGVFLFVSSLVILSARIYRPLFEIMGRNLKLRTMVLVGIAFWAYWVISPDIVRALYYPTIILWMIIGMMLLKRWSCNVVPYLKS